MSSPSNALQQQQQQQQQQRQHEQGMRLEQQRSLPAAPHGGAFVPAAAAATAATRRWWFLTEKEIQTAKKLTNLPHDETILQPRGTIMKVKTLQKLMPPRSLDDEVIDSFMALLQERNDRLRPSASAAAALAALPAAAAAGDSGGTVVAPPPQCKFFSSLFYPALCSFGYEGVQRMTQDDKTDVFAKDLLLLPVHVKSENHWALGCADIRRRHLAYYDSLGDREEGINFCRRMMRYLANEHADKKGSPLPDAHLWCSVLERVPKQTIPRDCGVFCCQFADCLGAGRPFDFRQHDITAIRYKMILQLASGFVPGVGEESPLPLLQTVEKGHALLLPQPSSSSFPSSSFSSFSFSFCFSSSSSSSPSSFPSSSSFSSFSPSSSSFSSFSSSSSSSSLPSSSSSSSPFSSSFPSSSSSSSFTITSPATSSSSSQGKNDRDGTTTRAGEENEGGTPKEKKENSWKAVKMEDDDTADEELDLFPTATDETEESDTDTPTNKAIQM